MVLGLLTMGASFLVMVFGAAAENQKHTVPLLGAIPSAIPLDGTGHIMIGKDPAHAARLRVLDGKVECFGVFSDLERDALSILSTPQSFIDQVQVAAEELDWLKIQGKPRFYEITLPEGVEGFDLRYGGFHPESLQSSKPWPKKIKKRYLYAPPMRNFAQPLIRSWWKPQSPAFLPSGCFGLISWRLWENCAFPRWDRA